MLVPFPRALMLIPPSGGSHRGRSHPFRGERRCQLYHGLWHGCTWSARPLQCWSILVSDRRACGFYSDLLRCLWRHSWSRHNKPTSHRQPHHYSASNPLPLPRRRALRFSVSSVVLLWPVMQLPHRLCSSPWQPRLFSLAHAISCSLIPTAHRPTCLCAVLAWWPCTPSVNPFFCVDWPTT